MELENGRDNILKMESDKKRISILRSGNSRAIISTINEIRQDGTISVLPELFNLLLDTEDQEIISACTSLLNDLKTEESVDMIITALKNKTFIPIRQILVSACWQNGLDYHNDILIFTDILLTDDYATAFEAFTVIENSLGDLDDHQIVRIIEKLNSGLKTMDTHKKPLVEALLNMIRNY